MSSFYLSDEKMIWAYDRLPNLWLADNCTDKIFLTPANNIPDLVSLRLFPGILQMTTVLIASRKNLSGFIGLVSQETKKQSYQSAPVGGQSGAFDRFPQHKLVNFLWSALLDQINVSIVLSIIPPDMYSTGMIIKNKFFVL